MVINIPRFVEMLKEKTTVYSPLVEAIVNSIEAIWETKRRDGKITITPQRSTQMPLDGEALPDIMGFTIEDNGIGFNDEHRDAFNELCTNYRIKEGGKGLGRFIFLKYFKKVRVSSIYEKNDKYCLRQFNLGSKNEIIENETKNEIDAPDTKTILYLEELKEPASYDKKRDTIARRILERILVFFVNEKVECPIVALREGDREIILNDLLKNNQEIQHIKTEEFPLQGFKTPEQQESLYKFKVRIYKIVYPETRTSKICLTANGRQVTGTSLSNYIPEFKDDFYDEVDGVKRNYRIMAYVLGEYLDKNVSWERVSFDFHAQRGDALYPLSQQDIEKGAANIIEATFLDKVTPRRQERYKIIQKYVDESAPWYKPYLKYVDLSTLPSELDEQAMETALQQIKFQEETSTKAQLKKIMEDPKIELFAKAHKLVESLQQGQTADLARYVALRKIVLEFLKKLLQMKDDGKYSLEAEIHNLIFPMKTDSGTTNYSEHNLWILDERLNFSVHISSDKALSKEKKERPDLIIYNKRMAYRVENEKSSPITIFEFKQPRRDDFADRNSKDDPIQKIIGYTVDIKLGEYTTILEGRPIHVDDDTPFYGYLICDFNTKVQDWIYKMWDFHIMPDGQGYYRWFDNNRLYIEALSWDKVLNDSELRNKIFFKKLGIDTLK